MHALQTRRDWVQAIKSRNQVAMREENTGNADEKGPKGGVSLSSEDQVMKRAGETRDAEGA